jgi:tryptophan synthase alpha chain
MTRTIPQTFADLRAANKIGLIPFLPAGYPDLPTTAAALVAADAAGAACIEVGFPFSDPIADGPVIQEAFTAALAKKLTVAQIFTTIRAVHGKLAAPLVAMVSYSIVFRHGPALFIAEAAAAGFSGLIIPDLPPPEADKVCALTRAARLETILLIAPTTSPERRKEIVRLCSGFVYYLSVSGVTGERDALPAGLAQTVQEIKAMTDLPVCVGFGLHRREQIVELAKCADGAVVGSAIVRRIKEHAAEGPEKIAAVVGGYIRQLGGAT